MIYFDNAATTYPKPEEVYKALDNANRNLAFNAGRGEYKESTDAFKLIVDTRKKLASLINRKSSEVIFTASATESLNLIINGLGIEKGDNIYISPFEHNAIVRPLNNLRKSVEFNIKVLPFEKDTWNPDFKKIENEFAISHPKAVLISHVSNVTGYLIPYSKIFELAQKWDSINILDCAQSFGVLNPTDIENINYIVFAGHKSLYATFGVGGFIKLKNDVLLLTKTGGTGTDSLNLEMPKLAPYRYEAGSPNVVAIAGLNTSIDWLCKTNVKEKEEKLLEYLLKKLDKNNNLLMYKPRDLNIFGVLSINVLGYKSEEVASILNDEYDICVRAGYHCAPMVHEFLNTSDYNGTVRISLNYYNTFAEIDCLVKALESM